MKIRKIYIAVFIFVFIVFPLGAITKSIDIQGGYNDFFSIDVRIVDAPSVSYTAGMPFDLESDGVNPYTAENGILVATWSMLTNQPKFTFKIKCDPLKPVDPAQKDVPANLINYILTFNYRLSIYESGQSISMSPTKFKVSSDGNLIDPSPRNPIKTDTVYDESSLMGTNVGEIYLKLTEDNYVKDPNSKMILKNVASGDYQGLVRIVMEVVK